MSGATLDFLVPGSLDQRTGGYLYDRHVVAGLRAEGWDVVVHNLDGAFPAGDDVARASLQGTLAGLPDGSRVVIDGLAMGGLPEEVRAHAARLRVVGLVHHPLADETGIGPEEKEHFTATEQSALAACRGVIVTSGYTARRLEDFHVPPDRIRAVPPGTRPAPVAEGPPEGDPPRLVCVATLTPRKGHDVLVDALARISDLPWSCVFAGSAEWAPAHAEAIRERVVERGLSSRIHFVGEHDTEGLDALYAESSIFVLASYYEGYGMALAEALARGLPVVSTTGGAIPYTVPGDAGLLVEPGDADAFARALRTLLTPDDDGGNATRARLAAAARHHAGELSDWDETARAFGEAVLELVPDE